MKKTLTIVLLLLATTFAIAQSNTNFSYLVGSTKVSGYAITTCSFDATNYNLPVKSPAPILQIYVLKKDSFIGGTLEDEKGKKTVIKDITLESKDKKDTVFIVTGTGFSRSFKLTEGAILKEEKGTTVFYTNKIGIWKIIKK